ncbi:hypothetical protein [Pedobacter segetis]|uniref:hypothetical protein n=1 Tax=Pedobacter segetis TaxID=2793069 RepID=UPI00190D2E34|nr:hypothetical protein [Pedobacter segetis]
MIKTSTPTSNPISNKGIEDFEMANSLNLDILRFYNTLKPSLNKYLKQPSDKVVQNILDFSKSLSN